MKNRTLRLTLVLLALAAAGAAGFYVFLLEQQAAAVREADRSFAEDVLRLQGILGELRASQAGYLAAGQDAAYWIERVGALREQADKQWQRVAQAPAGAGSPADVGELLVSFGRTDEEVRSLLTSEMLGPASERIFGAGARTVAQATAALGVARGASAASAGARLADIRRLELYSLGGAGGVMLLALLLLVPRGRRPAAPADGATLDAPRQAGHAEVGIPAEDRPGLGLDFPLAPRSSVVEAPRPIRSGDDSWEVPFGPETDRARDAALDEPERAQRNAHDDPTPFAITHRGGREAASQVDLAEAARLCTDLARVQDTSELQGLLARAAALLDASGIVVWMAGAEADVLWPAFSHGYTPQALARMHAVPRDGATPVSVAFRKELVEVVPAAEGGGSSAVVVPILTSAGCVGAMAIELRPGAESRDADQALARIVAAQLATLVAGES